MDAPVTFTAADLPADPQPRPKPDLSWLHDFALYVLLLTLAAAIVIEIAYFGTALILSHVSVPACYGP